MTGRRPPSRSARPTTPPKPQGFTLVEVLVAVAIVAVALAAGSRAGQTLLANAQRLGDVTAAQWCADNLLNNLVLAKRFPDLGETQGECQQLGQTFQSILRVQGTPNPNFRRVDVSVRSATGVPLLTLSTVLPRHAG